MYLSVKKTFYNAFLSLKAFLKDLLSIELIFKFNKGGDDFVKTNDET